MTTTRGKNFGPTELQQLCYSFLEISQDPCVGSGQKKDSFWERIAEHYEKNKGGGLESRSAKSLERKWGDVRKATTRFIACDKAIDDLNIYGLSAPDMFRKAKELYKQRHPKNKDFTFEVCYYILKECPRWMLPEDQMKKSKRSRKETTSNGTEILEKDKGPSDDSDIQSETEGLQKDNGSSMQKDNGSSMNSRPVGSKLTKENVKKARHVEDALKMSAQAQKLMAETGLQRLRVLETQTFMNMLTLPLEHMDMETQQFLSEWKRSEMEKIKGQLTPPSSASPPPGFTRPPTASRSSLPTRETLHDNEELDKESPDITADGEQTLPDSNEWDMP